MEKYTHVGMLFEKSLSNDHIILRPTNIARCNIIDDTYYDVEFIDEEVMDCFIGSFDDFGLTIGFVNEIEKLKEEYGSIEDGIQALKRDIIDYVFIQTYDDTEDITTTYKADFYNKKFINVAEYKDDALTYKHEEISFTDDKFLNKYNIKTEPIIIDKTKENKEDKNIIPNINMVELYKSIKESIIGQDEAIKQVVSTIDRNYSIDNFRNKTNILLIGPSGSGKTEMFRTIESAIKIPTIIEDSEQYSAVGYQGSSIEDMLVKLYHKANGNLKLAEKGILVIDEIDKKITDSKDDVSGTRVLNSLLSLMEGTTFRINTTGNDYDPNYVTFDTSYLTVVLAGAFSFMVTTDKGMGFTNALEKKNTYNEIDIKKLNDYGLSNELLRRVSIYKLNELSVDNLVDIMNKSKNSYLKEMEQYAEKKKINLIINDNTIRKLAEKAKAKNIGASGIKATLNEILNDAFFDVELNKKKYNTIEVTEESLEQTPPYILKKKRNTT